MTLNDISPSLVVIFLFLVLVCAIIVSGMSATLILFYLLQKVKKIYLRLITAISIAIFCIPLIFNIQFLYLMWGIETWNVFLNVMTALGYIFIFSIAVIIPSIILQKYLRPDEPLKDIMGCAAIVFATGPIFFFDVIRNPLDTFLFPNSSDLLLNPHSPLFQLIIGLLISFITITGFSTFIFGILIGIRIIKTGKK